MKFITKIQEGLLPKKTDSTFFYAIKALIQRYAEDDLSGVGGQLAYFFVISLFPFLMLVNYVFSIVKMDSSTITTALSKIVPENMMGLIDMYFGYVSETESRGIFTFGIIITVMTASKAISVLMGSLNKAFRSEGQIGIVRSLISYVLMIFILLLILVSLVFLSVGGGLFERIILFFGLPIELVGLWNIVRWVVPVGGMIVVNTVLYSIIAGKNVPKKYLIIGAVFSTFLWIIMGITISFYTANVSNYSLVYGTLGAIIIMLLFLYWSGIVIVLGGELAHILAMRKKGDFSFDVK